MASESTIASQIRTALAEHLKRDVSRVQPGNRLREDLGLDSLAMIELLFKIEEHFDLEIPNEDLSRITTVADVTAYVEDKLGARGAGAAHAAPAPLPAAVERPTVGAAAKTVMAKRGAATRRTPKAGAKAASAKKKGARRA